MDKPKGFVHREKRLYKAASYNVKAVYTTHYHVGRLEISAEAVAVLTTLYCAGMVVTWVILGIVTGWTTWWPLWALLAVLAVFTLVGVLKIVTSFFRYLAGEIKINGPTGSGS